MQSKRLDDTGHGMGPTARRSGLLDLDAQWETLDLDAQQEAALLIILKLDLQCKGLTSELYFHANGFL